MISAHFSEQDIFSALDTILDTLNWLQLHNLQPKGVHSSYCGAACFSLTCAFALLEAVSFFVAPALGMRLHGLFFTSATHERATV